MCQYLSDMVKDDVQKFVIVFFFLELIKSMLVYLFHGGGLYHKETSPMICSVSEWTSF